MGMANNIYKTLGSNAQTLTILATVCLEDPVTQEKAKTLLDKALAQRPDYTKAVVKKAELLSTYNQQPCSSHCTITLISALYCFLLFLFVKAGNRNMKKASLFSVMPWPIRVTVSCTECWEIS